MNYQPTMNAFKSYYRQAMDQESAGNITNARELYLKAAELANAISVNAKSYDVRIEYHNLAETLLKKAKFLGEKPSAVVGHDEKSVEFLPVKNSGITFQDVAGLDDVKEQIIYSVLEPLKNPSIAAAYDIRPGAKILLYGPPGTGKTYIAKAISGEINADFFAVDCHSLISKYLGDSSKNLSELFRAAREKERAVIFFDEFDAIASQRDSKGESADAEISRFVATFLTEVDGFASKDDKNMILMIAATNRPWAIDKAVLRGGRFDTHIYVGLPDQKSREFLVNKELASAPIDKDVDMRELAENLKGFGGGDITAICRRIKQIAYIRAVKANQINNITKDDCFQAISEAHNMISDDDLKRYYEFGRALSND